MDAETDLRINPSLAPLTVPIGDLKPDSRNARLHDPRSIESIAASLRDYGQQKPVVALQDGTVVAGNGTLAAALSLGWTSLAVVRFEDEAKARAFAISDNRTAELSEWDWKELAAQLAEVGSLHVGFDEHEVARIMAAADSFTPTAETEWEGMPEFEVEDQRAVRQILVSFAKEEDVARFAEVIGQGITDKTRYLWFPEAVREAMMDKRYAEAPKEEAK